MSDRSEDQGEDADSRRVMDYEDVSVYTLDDADEQRLLDAQSELTFMWTNREGWPVGVIMSFVHRDGRFWVTGSRQRARFKAIERDDRVAVCVTSTGSKIGGGKTVTYKGRATIHDDEPTKAWFYPALATKLMAARAGGEGRDERIEEFIRFLDSPRRVIVEIEPLDRIAYDGAKMAHATASSR